MCSYRKYPYSPHPPEGIGGHRNFLGGWGFSKNKSFEENTPSMGEVWIFSGTTQFKAGAKYM